jgi:hypothetical protein
MGEGKKDKKDKKEKKAAAAAGNGVGDVQAVTDFLIKPEKTGLGESQIYGCGCGGCTASSWKGRLCGRSNRAAASLPVCISAAPAGIIGHVLAIQCC